jgi:hypothetical protein
MKGLRSKDKSNIRPQQFLDNAPPQERTSFSSCSTIVVKRRAMRLDGGRSGCIVQGCEG